MPVLIIDNEATAARRRVPLLIFANTAGAAWAGSVTGAKARLSLNGATEVASTADVVRVNGAWHYVELTQAETNRTPGDRLLVRVASAAGRLEASSVVEITADDPYAAAPTDASIATAVWASGTRTLTSFGTLVADIATAVWGAATRTLTSAGAGGATAAEVWSYVTRTLTSGGGGTAPTAAENATATVNALAGAEGIPARNAIATSVAAPSEATIAAASATQTMVELAGAGGSAARTAIAASVDGAVADNFAAVPAAVDAQMASRFAAIPTASANTTATEAALLDNFAALTPPTAAAVSSQVMTDLAGAAGAASREAMADSFLGRALQGGANGGRTVRDALRSLRNRVFRNVGTGLVTVTTEDDTTAAWTTQTTTNTAAAPVTESNPT